ncbi:MAG: glucosamine-6-phosphate deaminase [Planctomycetota bacterium]|jgi:glucosamine-6-phosphate deaminase
MEVIIGKDYEEISRAAAKVVADIIDAKPDAVLGLATGSTPLGLYKELIRLHKKEGLDFSKVTTFNLDEYVGLTPDHDQSYHYFMYENLFKHINVRMESTHVPSGTASDYMVFCDWYEQKIEDAGGIDVQILGIGSDGHIAFNEPGSSLTSRTRIKTLAEPTISDNARFFKKKEDVPIYACTMGVGTILDAGKLILLANGAGKVEAISAAIEGPVSVMCTASALQLHPDSLFFIDEDAAGGLKMKDYYKWIQAKKPGAPIC